MVSIIKGVLGKSMKRNLLISAHGNYYSFVLLLLIRHVV